MCDRRISFSGAIAPVRATLNVNYYLYPTYDLSYLTAVGETFLVNNGGSHLSPLLLRLPCRGLSRIVVPGGTNHSSGYLPTRMYRKS